VGAGRGFGVVLNTKNRFGLVPHAFHGAVIEVDAIHYHVTGKRAGVNRETVILGGDLHPA
jgi:hypothetical protein